MLQHGKGNDFERRVNELHTLRAHDLGMDVGKFKKAPKRKLKVDLCSGRNKSAQPRKKREEAERTEETSSFPNASPQVGHFRARLESRASIHSLQKRWPHRLMMTPLKRKLQVEHLSIFYRNRQKPNQPGGSKV